MEQKKRRAKGEGSFRENPDGTITHRKTIGFKVNGYRKILTVTADSRSACIKIMRKNEKEWNRKQKSEAVENMTITELCEKHLQYQMDNDELKPKSIDRRECTIENHIMNYDIGKQFVVSLRGGNVEDHINYLMKKTSLSESSILKVLDVLNAAFVWLVRRGELEFNPVLSVKDSLKRKILKRKEKEATEADVIFMSEEEVEQFIAEAKRKDLQTGLPMYSAGLYGLLLLYTGMRCGEMLALTWGDIDIEKGYLTINKNRVMVKNRDEKKNKKYEQNVGTTKNEKARTIELTKEALEVLREIKNLAKDKNNEDLVVLTKNGTPNTATNVGRRMSVIYKNAGLNDISGVHILRRTFATTMYEKGMRSKEIAAYIGDLESTTERYYIGVRKKVIEGGKVLQVVQVRVGEKGAIDENT